MSRMKSAINVPALLMAVAFGALLGYQSFGQRAVQPAAPVVASVQIDKLFEELEVRAAAKVEISRIERQIEEEKTRREEEIKGLDAELEETVAAARRRELDDQIKLKTLQLSYWLQEAVSVLEVEKALQLQNLYKSVRQAIGTVATAEGYDIVLVNDESNDLPFDRESRVPAQLQILQQIASRKILYMNNAIDITDDVIVRMNNQFRAGP